MGRFQQKWTSEQKDAIEFQWFDRGLRPLRRICNLAHTGQLKDHTGQDLEPFPMPYPTMQEVIKNARKRRAGQAKHELTTVPHKDAIELLRRRLVNMSATLLDQYEKQVIAKPNTADPERLRQIARAMREVAALPGPGETAPKPGAKRNGERNGGQTSGGLAGSILSDMRAEQGGTAPEHPTPEAGTQGEADTPAVEPTHEAQQSEEAADEHMSGSLALARAQQLAG